jgi:hypothetical protein
MLQRSPPAKQLDGTQQSPAAETLQLRQCTPRSLPGGHWAAQECCRMPWDYR